MSKINLPDITSGYNLSLINNNFQKIEDALNQEVLYRTSHVGEPNEMETNLDMNGKEILNVHDGSTPGSLATKGYVDQEISEERAYVDNSLSTKYDKTGGALSGDVLMQGYKIKGLNFATENSEPVTLGQVLDIDSGTGLQASITAFEALRRSYAEAGYNLIGTFSNTGLVINYATDVVLWEPTGIAYAYSGTLPHTIGDGETPVGNPQWVARADDTLRANLSDQAGLSLVGVVDSVAALRLLSNLPIGRKIQLLGYHPGAPGVGGGTLIVTSDTTSPDDGVRVFVTADGTRLIRETNGFIYASQAGAVSGSGDDTDALLRAASSKLDVIVDGAYTIVDSTIQLFDGQKWSGGGGSIRQVCITLNPAPANPDAFYPASSSPLFHLKNKAKVNGVEMYPAFEAVSMEAGTSFVGNKCYGEGRTWYDGILCFGNDCLIEGNEVYDFGQWLPGVTYAVRGDTISISPSSTQTYRVRVHNNRMQGGAKNGLFIIGAVDSSFTNNMSIANRMSGMQIAFLNNVALNATRVLLSDNICQFNGADSIDVNNASGLPAENCDVSALITNNSFVSNGWIYPTREEQLSRTGLKQQTPDGAGFTFVNVKRAYALGNHVADNAKVCAYLVGSIGCKVEDNVFIKLSSHPGDSCDGFYIKDDIGSSISGNSAIIPRAAYRFENIIETTIKNNSTATSVSGVDGAINADSTQLFIFESNTLNLVNGNFIAGYGFQHSNCYFKASVSGSAIYGNLTYAVFKDNKYSYPSGNVKFDACASFIIEGMNVESSTAHADGAVTISGATGTCTVKNPQIVQRGTTAAATIKGGAFSMNITGGHIAHTAAGNNIRVVNGTVGMVIRTDNIDISTGFPDFTGASRQQLTWA